MNELRDRLERARDQAPDQGTNLEALYTRRRARATRSRVVTIVVAGAIGLGAIGLVLGSIASGRGGHSLASGGLGAPTVDLSLGDGAYYLQRFDSGYGVCESWWATDDSGKLATAGAPSERGSCWGPKAQIFGPGEFYSDSGPVANLSTDPTELEAQLRQRVEPGGVSPEPYQDWGGPVEWGLIRSIHELLEASDVSPAQKAALFRVAAGLDGVTIDTDVQDPWGRPAILLTTTTEDQLHEWYFDPESEQLLVEMSDGNVEFKVLSAGVTHSTDTIELDRSFFAERSASA